MAEPLRQLDIRILGPLEVRAGERLLPLTAAKQKTILALLALHRGEVVSVDALLEALWGERPPVSAQTALQGYVSQLRRLLESGEAGGAALLVTRAPGYLLDVDQEVDLARFERLTASGRDALVRDDASGAARLLGEALELWRGSPLAEFAYDGWARNEIARLEELRLAALEDRLEADLATGRHGELVAELEALVAEQPLRERLHGHLILALYRAGRQADALEAYQRARAVLVDELGLDPGPELQELHRLILNQDDTLAAPERASRAPIVHLPTPLTPLLGRERELAEASARLSTPGVRLLTITGPGGIGKTRVAVELARRAADEHQDGVWFVDLSALRDPALVLPSIQQSIGADGNLASTLARKRTLLVLDNLEQVLDVAPELGALLGACPELRILATSREPLHLSGENEYPLPPLPEDEATALFLERARAIEADFAANGEVAEICRRLDGLPLAIELAAARVKLLSPPQLLSRLEQRLPLLTIGSRDLPDRQRTLRTTVEWSHDLLTDAEKQLFANLAVFSGGWSLEAAEQICNAQLDTLQALVDKNLIRAHGERFTMLETIREYSVEKLEEHGEATEARRRHIDYFIGRASEAAPGLRSHAEHVVLKEIAVDHDNFRAALAHALATNAIESMLRLAGALLEFWWIHGHFDEGRRWIEQGLATGDAVPPDVRARALDGASYFAYLQGDQDRAVECASESLRIWRAVGDLHGVTRALNELACAVEEQGHYRQASALYDEALEIARELRDSHGAIIMASNLAGVELLQRNYAHAEELLEEALQQANEHGYRVPYTVTQIQRAFLSLDRGLDERAHDDFMEALMASWAVEFIDGVSDCLGGLAAILTAKGDTTRAVRLIGAAQAFRKPSRIVPRKFVRDIELRVSAESRDRVGERAYAELIAEGRALSLDDAVGLLLERS